MSDQCIADYLTVRKEARYAEADRMLARLGSRTQKLVREAAVMGFVQGAMAAGGISRDDFPKDSQILMLVFTGAQSMPDIYKTLG